MPLVFPIPSEDRILATLVHLTPKADYFGHTDCRPLQSQIYFENMITTIHNFFAWQQKVAPKHSQGLAPQGKNESVAQSADGQELN